MLLTRGITQLARGITRLTEFVERRVFDVDIRSKRESDRDSLIGEATLLPPLSDELVFSQIWPLLHKKVNVSLLWRLRKVNRAWKKKVGTSLEWAALEFVRVDSPGFLQLLEKRGERRPSLRERVESELDSLAVLFAENLSDFSSQVEMSLSTVVGSESVEGGEELGFVRVRSGVGVDTSSRLLPCICREADYACFDKHDNVGRDEPYWSEEEEVESCSSSSGSSMRIYYPRHNLRDQ